MAERTVIAREARAQLGPLLAALGAREWGPLARLLHPGERVEVLAVAALAGPPIGSGRVVAATDGRILVVGKRLLGRERVREVAWDAIAEVTLTPPHRLVLAGPAERLELAFVVPAERLAALADLARLRLDPARAATPTTAELLDLARRKLGRLVASGAEPCTMALAGLLEPDESVLEIVFGSGSAGQGLLAATPARLLFVPSRGLGAGEPLSLPYASIVACGIEDGALRIAAADGAGLVVESATPVERAFTVAQIARARLPAPG